MDYLKLYDLERYLFEVVRPVFYKEGKLSAFDFVLIVIWKANRAKSKVAKKLLERDPKGRSDLDAIVGDLTSALASADSCRKRMRTLIEDWEFRLPMASAILAVLYPDSFTVYDDRVCEQLGNYKSVQNRKFEGLWQGYQEYVEAVKRAEPAIPELRDKDRTLWAKSFEGQLRDDIANSFGVGQEEVTQA